MNEQLSCRLLAINFQLLNENCTLELGGFFLCLCLRSRFPITCMHCHRWQNAFRKRWFNSCDVASWLCRIFCQVKALHICHVQLFSVLVDWLPQSKMRQCDSSKNSTVEQTRDGTCLFVLSSRSVMLYFRLCKTSYCNFLCYQIVSEKENVLIEAQVSCPV